MNRRRYCRCFLPVIFALILFWTLPFSTGAVSKGGVEADLLLILNDNDHTRVTAEITVINNSGQTLNGLKVSMTPGAGFVQGDGMQGPVSLKNSGTHTFRVELISRFGVVSGATERVGITTGKTPAGNNDSSVNNGGDSTSATVVSGTTNPDAAGTDGTGTSSTAGAVTTTDTEAAQPVNTDGGAGAVVVAVIAVAAVTGIAVAVILLIRKKKKAMLSLLLAGTLTLSAVAFTVPASALEVSQNMTVSKKVTMEGFPYTVSAKVSYTQTFAEAEESAVEDMDEFEITYYWGPKGTKSYDETYIKAIADAGFTSIPLENNSADINKKALNVMAKYGLTCSALCDQRIQNLIGSDRESSPNTSQADVDQVVAEVILDYAGYDNIEGWWLYDEPSAAKFEILGKVVDAFKRLDPTRETFIDLFPTYADNEQLGANGYGDYLNKYINAVDPVYLCYDHYHFLKNGSARQGFFTNLEYIRDAGLKNQLDYMTIVLLTKHQNYADLTPAQIRWQVNMAMAYGAKRMSYFTFIVDQALQNEGWSNGMMDDEGNKYPHYTDVQAINKWLLPLGRELFDKTSTAVFHLDDALESGCDRYTGYGKLGDVSGDDLVIGFFDDDSFMMVNKQYGEGQSNTVTLNAVSNGLQVFDTASASWKDAVSAGVAVSSGGKLQITLEAGEGILLKVQDASP